MFIITLYVDYIVCPVLQTHMSCNGVSLAVEADIYV